MDPSSLAGMGMNVEVDPQEDTEWNDILRAHKIIPEKPKDPDENLEEVLEEARARKHAERLDDLELDELDELEDNENDEIVQEYKARRIREMRETADRSVFGDLLPLSKAEYMREVTEASQKHWVMVYLYKNYVTASNKLRPVMQEFAQRYGHIKVCAITADQAIEGYPDAAVPTILVYHDGDMVDQFVGLKAGTGLGDIERLMIGLSALHEDEVRRARKREKTSNSRHDDDDGEVDDWSD